MADNRFRQRLGFTLIELLVVISIIAILAAMLMPVLRRARQRALEIDCVNRQRQIVLGTIQFAQDNGAMFPSYNSAPNDVAQFGGTLGKWYMHVKDYMGSTNTASADVRRESWLHCPDQANEPPPANPTDGRQRPWLAYNIYFGWMNAANHNYARAHRVVYQHQVVSPSRSGMFGHQVPSNPNIGTVRYFFYISSSGFGTAHAAYDHHYGSAPWGYADGHAEALDASEAFELHKEDFNSATPRTYFARPKNF